MAYRLPGKAETLLDKEIRAEENLYFSHECEKSLKSGRYSLQTAARLIADAAGVHMNQFYERFVLDARNRTLPVYRVGHTVRFAEENGFPSTWEAYWDDLNAWLDANEPRTIFRFSSLLEAAAPVVNLGASETKEQRQDRRLKACIDAGLPMDTKAALLRLPDGVGKVADRENVTRQTFSTDVKAALKRRESAIREGVTVHRA